MQLGSPASSTTVVAASITAANSVAALRSPPSFLVTPPVRMPGLTFACETDSVTATTLPDKPFSDGPALW